jgi:hypothetical protein
MHERAESQPSLQAAHRADFGRELDDAEAEALGHALLNVLGPLLLARAAVHRSSGASVDESVNKREPVRPTQETL